MNLNSFPGTSSITASHSSLRIRARTHGLPVELPEVVNPRLISFPARSICSFN